MKKIRVQLKELKQGMRVADDVYAVNGTLIALKNAIIDKKLLSLFERYHIDIVNIQRDQKPEEVIKQPTVIRFQETFQKIYVDIKESFQHIALMEEELNVEETTLQLEELITEVDSGYDLLNMLLDTGQQADSIYQHSLQVAILSHVLGSWLKLPEKDVALLGVAGLFHDIGKCRIQSELLNKSGTLSSSEYETIRQHAVMGYKIVKNKNIDIRMKQAILSHHERCDGSGYPLGLKADGIGQFARIVAIADAYAGMTSNRPYRERSFSPFEVVNYLEKEGFGKFDSEYLMKFLSHIPNSYIKRKALLSDGRIGQIVFINKANLSRPLLKMPDSYLDLALNPELSIVKVM